MKLGINVKQANKLMNSPMTRKDEKQLKRVHRKIQKNATNGWVNCWVVNLLPRVSEELEGLGYSVVKHGKKHQYQSEISWSDKTLKKYENK